jgi:hypothetical protein
VLVKVLDRLAPLVILTWLLWRLLANPPTALSVASALSVVLIVGLIVGRWLQETDPWDQ